MATWLWERSTIRGECGSLNPRQPPLPHSRRRCEEAFPPRPPRTPRGFGMSSDDSTADLMPLPPQAERVLHLDASEGRWLAAAARHTAGSLTSRTGVAVRPSTLPPGGTGRRLLWGLTGHRLSLVSDRERRAAEHV